MAFNLRDSIKPAIALVGCPNVGKSTLFNRLTRSRDALVADIPGLTRDPNIGVGKVGKAGYLVVDTGGIDHDGDALSLRVTQQALHAAQECDAIIFMVDGKAGINAGDEALAATLRQCHQPVFLAVNKTDGRNVDIAAAEFASLGVGQASTLSASHGTGVEALIERITNSWPVPDAHQDKDSSIRVAIIGRPNVGKSTLVNRILGEQRVIASDKPGTTRDSIAIPFERRGKHYTLIDTAGLRRKSRITETIEKFSVLKSLQAIEGANVIILVMDAQDTISEQDASLLGLIINSGRSLVIAVNKWDGLNADQRNQIRTLIDRRLRFIDYAEIRYISALHGTGVGGLFEAINAAWASACISPATHKLTDLLERAVSAHAPPSVRGRRIKLRYAHMGGHNPPTIIIHGNQTQAVPDLYQRYLTNFFRHALTLVGTPVRIEFRTGENPYAGRRNQLTARQQTKRRRLLKHVKKRR